jgi:hypothetical protein
MISLSAQVLSRQCESEAHRAVLRQIARMRVPMVIRTAAKIDGLRAGALRFG